MNLICGIDEAGRGPLAGPVTAAAVILPNDFKVELLRDSKKLSPKKRLELSDLILKTCFFGIGWASPEEIDELEEKEKKELNSLIDELRKVLPHVVID